MKTWKLLLLALVPGLWGWLCNWLTAVSLNGPAFLFTLAFYIQVPGSHRVLPLAGASVRPLRKELPRLPAADPVAQPGELCPVRVAVPLCLQ